MWTTLIAVPFDLQTDIEWKHILGLRDSSAQTGYVMLEAFEEVDSVNLDYDALFEIF